MVLVYILYVVMLELYCALHIGVADLKPSKDSILLCAQ
jgi:hypothetical protein